MEVTLCLLSIIYFTVVMGQGPVAPGDFQAICRTDFRYRGAHEWIPYVNPTSAGVRGEVRWQVLVDQYDYQNLIEPGQTPPSPWETRDIDGDGLQFTDTGGGNCLFTVGVTSNSYRNPMANNWVFTQSVDYLEAIEVIVNASVRFRGCQQRAVADPPCQKNYVTLHRYDTNTPTTVSERTDPNNYQPYLQNATTSRLELSTMDSGTIIMTYRRPQHFNFTHFGIQDTGTYGSVLRLLVYYKVAQGFEDGLVVCPSVALPPAGSGETNTRSCMCKANATPTANLVRTCNQNGVCQQSPAAAQCECNAGYEYNNVSKTCQGCRMGTYKSDVSNDACLPCPANSMTINGSSTVCDCIRGTVRCPSKPNDPCQDFHTFFTGDPNQCQVSSQGSTTSSQGSTTSSQGSSTLSQGSSEGSASIRREGVIAITFFVTLILTAVITALIMFIVLYILWKK